MEGSRSHRGVFEPSGCHIEMQTLGKPCASVSSFVQWG